jgi:very-short-patch-repair endonuclease
VLRFTNADVVANVEGTVAMIEQAIARKPPSHEE